MFLPEDKITLTYGQIRKILGLEITNSTSEILRQFEHQMLINECQKKEDKNDNK